MSSGQLEDADDTKRGQRHRRIRIIVGLFMLLLGVPPLLNVSGNPRLLRGNPMSIARFGWVWCAAPLGLALVLGLSAAREADKPTPLDCTGKDGVSAADLRKAQEAWAKYLGRQVEETIEIADGVKMSFVLIPPGKFRMGSPADEKDREPGGLDETLHEVTLTEPFDLGKTEVTQAQYQALGVENPSMVKGADRPVEGVTWAQARDWAANLTKKRGDNHQYRLPTEAEWEYSCRGGRSSSIPFGVGDGRALCSREANFDGKYPYGGADKGPSLEATRAVGSYKANALGLHDMHGNVWEWCLDRKGPYPREAVTNPTGPETEGSARVIRGGSWSMDAGRCRAAHRAGIEETIRSREIGFRLARSVPSGGK
jgi:formylglycine-generating enzyme required for sulfatase activity